MRFIKMNREQLLKEALKVVSHRGKDYGDIKTNHERIAALWSVILEKEVKATDVALCMVAVKMARLIETPDHQDSWVDIAGYSATGSECLK